MEKGMSRKRFLTLCVTGIIFVGLLFAAYPFLASWGPNPKSERLVLELDISGIPPGGSKLVEWRGRPFMIYRPSLESSQYLISLNEVANGPDYTLKNMPDFFAYFLLSTYLGCALKDTGEEGFGYDKYVGYLDPCHSGFWDYAGRLLPSVHGGQGLDNLDGASNYRKLPNSVIRFEY